jgi:hypothetical protein
MMALNNDTAFHYNMTADQFIATDQLQLNQTNNGTSDD